MKCYEDKKGRGGSSNLLRKHGEFEPCLAFFQGNLRKDVKSAALLVFMRDLLCPQ